jgi:hypothetical protein
MNINVNVGGFLLASVAAAFLAGSAASAQPAPEDRMLREPAYRELQRLSQQLDARAEHAADVAQHDRYRLYRRDSTFLRMVSDFARRASRFDARLARYRAEPWPVSEEVGALARGARDIQGRVRLSRGADEHILSDWNEIVEIVSRMEQIRDRGNRPGPGDFGPPQRVEARDSVRNPPPPPDRRLDEYGERGPAGPGDSRGDRLGGLARELEDSAGRAVQAAERTIADSRPYRREYLQTIRDFKSQAAALGRAIGSGALNPGQIRAEASRLLDIVRSSDQRMRQENTFRQVWPDWQGAIQSLQRIIDLTR